MVLESEVCREQLVSAETPATQDPKETPALASPVHVETMVTPVLKVTPADLARPAQASKTSARSTTVDVSICACPCSTATIALATPATHSDKTWKHLPAQILHDQALMEQE